MGYQEFLSEEVEAALEYLVAETDRPKSYYRELLAEVDIKTIEDVENFQDYFVGIYVLDRVRRGLEPVYSWDEFWKRQGLED